MKKLLLILLITSSLKAQQFLIVDPDFSPFMGAYDLLFLQSSVRAAQDVFTPNPTRRNGTAQTWERGINQLAYLIINGTLDVTQHEFFGHGYRLRDLGFSDLHYQILPWEGATYFDAGGSTPIGDLLAITVAGLESEAVMAQKTKMYFIRKKSIDGRLSSLYTGAMQSLFWYTAVTQLGEIEDQEEEFIPSNDVESYLFLLNATYPQNPVSLSTLLKIAAFNWLDPMTFYSFFSWFYYIAEGTPWSFPMIPLKKDIRYLPNIHIGYAPYGVEAYFDNFFSFSDKPLYFYIKGGKRSFGLGIEYDYVFEKQKGVLGLHFDGWVQNRFISRATINDLADGLPTTNFTVRQKIWGMAASFTGSFYFFSRVGLFAELGGKTKGYLPGYSLNGGVVARAGLIIKDF